MKPLPVFRSYLTKQLKAKLDFKLEEINGHAPCEWTYVSADDYLSVSRTETAVAAYLDAEIGLVLYVVDYEGGDLLAEFTAALASSSRFQTARSGESNDPAGSWRVGLLWLVRKEHEATWRRAIAERRTRSGATEEVAVDVVVYRTNDSLLAALDAHGLPLLLMQYRALLRKPRIEVEAWASADDDVWNALEALPTSFSNQGERRLADAVVERASLWRAKGEDTSTKHEPKLLEQLVLKNFRNLKYVNLSFHSSDSTRVSPQVLFGPNGSGKSSIVEAISLAFAKTSRQMLQFHNDADQDQKVSYADTVLRTLGESSGPEITVNNEPIGVIDNLDSAALNAIDGSLLSQESALEFVRMSGTDLAAQALRDYSNVADEVLQFVEEQTRAASEQKDNLLRRLGERVSITKAETIFTRLVRNVCVSELPPEPLSLVRWLSNFSRLEHENRGDAQSLLHRAENNFSSQARTQLETRLAKRVDPFARDEIQSTFEAWISDWNNFSKQSAQLILRLEELGWQEKVDVWIENIKRLSAAKRDRSTFTEVFATEQAKRSAEARRGELQLELEAIVNQGKDVRMVISHLEDLGTLLGTWSKAHEKVCPTCGATHGDGISSVVDRRLQALRLNREELLQQHAEKKRELDALVILLSKAGSLDNELQQVEVQFASLFSRAYPGIPVADVLADTAKAQEIVGLLSELRTLPTVSPPLAESRAVSINIADKLRTLVFEANSALELPQQWAVVGTRVKEACEKILAEKLPSTLQRAWIEVVWALSPARWVLAANPSLALSSSRKSRKLVITAEISQKAVLARYLFNLSECHILGLAWFFIRYAAAGRFKNAFMVLDDPAQEMDQTTFSALVRFLAALSRVHRVRKMPLTLLVLMHQEERALEVARATDAMVHILTWSRSQGDEDGLSIKTLRLLQHGLGMPAANALMASPKRATA